MSHPASPTVFASGGGLDGVGGIAFGPNGNLFVSSLTPDYPNNATPPKVVQFNGSTGALIGDFVKNTGDSRFPPDCNSSPTTATCWLRARDWGRYWLMARCSA